MMIRIILMFLIVLITTTSTGIHTIISNILAYRTLMLVSLLVGDWQWYKQSMALTGWTGEGSALNVCYKCQANCTSHPWTDFSTEASWRGTSITHSAYVQNCLAERKYVSAVFSIIGFQV